MPKRRTVTDKDRPWQKFDDTYEYLPQAEINIIAEDTSGNFCSGGPKRNITRWDSKTLTPFTASDGLPLLNLQAAPLRLTGPGCVQARMNCLAPNEDTPYQMSAKLPLDPEHFYAVVGPLSTATHNATYVGLGLNSSVRPLGFGNISDKDLAASATGYSNAVPSDRFFVQYFARDCSGLAENLPAGGELSMLRHRRHTSVLLRLVGPALRSSFSIDDTEPA